MSKINNSYESSNNSSMSSGTSEPLAPLDQTLENIEKGIISVKELMLPPDDPENITTEENCDTENDLIIASSASPCNTSYKEDSSIIFKGLQRQNPSSNDSEISDQDVKHRSSIICKEAVLEETVFEPTISTSISLNMTDVDLSFSGKFTDTSYFGGEKSPQDLFEDFEDDTNDDADANESSSTVNVSHEEAQQHDKKLFRRMKRLLSGVVPPPSVTSTTFKIAELLEKYHTNAETMDQAEISEEPLNSQGSLFKSNYNSDDIKVLEWPESTMVSTCHGLYYNRCDASEKVEELSLDLIQRYIGFETSSSYTVHTKSPQSSKKRTAKAKALMQSPGRRLSHLARRRALFSSANLKQASFQPFASTSRQIVLNPKQRDQKRLIIVHQSQAQKRTPKRTGRTPGKSKTPRSSKKKREIIHLKPVLTREQSKRALFQSPTLPHNEVPKPVISAAVAKRVEKSKRALFSPPKKLDRSVSFCENIKENQKVSVSNERHRSMGDLNEIFGKKRKRTDDDETEHRNKLPRSSSTQDPPGILKLQKSQSFFMPASQSSGGGGQSRESFFRTKTDIPSSSYTKVLSEHHKKKLLWAAATALKNKNITSSDPNYKKLASSLLRIVKTIFLQFDDPNLAGITSTSECMMRIANAHVFEVIKGSSYEDILHKERERLKNLKNTKKIEGYIGIAEYQEQKFNSRNRSSSIFSQDSSSIDTFSQCSSIVDGEWILPRKHDDHTTKMSVQQMGSLKKNDVDVVLKENVDTHLRQRSAQKNSIFGFSGKDQKNLSPYSHNNSQSSNSQGSVSKAKRQISFDKE